MESLRNRVAAGSAISSEPECGIREGDCGKLCKHGVAFMVPTLHFAVTSGDLLHALAASSTFTKARIQAG